MLRFGFKGFLETAHQGSAIACVLKRLQAALTIFRRMRDLYATSEVMFLWVSLAGSSGLSVGGLGGFQRFQQG